jgi:hypothetical protein
VEIQPSAQEGQAIISCMVAMPGKLFAATYGRIKVRLPCCLAKMYFVQLTPRSLPHSLIHSRSSALT